MLKIRLSRTGKKNQPHYRIVVNERRSKRDGSYVDNLGYYIPYTDPAVLKLNTKAFDEWVSKGAQVTEVVSYLRSQAKDGEEVQIKKSEKSKNNKHKRAKAEAEAEAGAKEESAPEPAADSATVDKVEEKKPEPESK